MHEVIETLDKERYLIFFTTFSFVLAKAIQLTFNRHTFLPPGTNSFKDEMPVRERLHLMC